MTSVPTPARLAVVPAAKVVPPTTNCVTVLDGPSTSVSLVRTLPDTGVSSNVVALSLTPIGASLTGVMVSVRVAVEVREPSVRAEGATGRGRSVSWGLRARPGSEGTGATCHDELRDGLGRAVDVCVIGEHVAGDRRVFQRGRGIIDANWRIVDGRDGERQGRSRGERTVG